jgi:uncharacterized protein YjbI with pentapeptide repeats
MRPAIAPLFVLGGVVSMVMATAAIAANQEHLRTLLITRECSGCNLEAAVLQGANLTGKLAICDPQPSTTESG